MKRVILAVSGAAFISISFLAATQAQTIKINFEDYLGESIALEGKAANAKLGAQLIGENFVIWIDGLGAWPEGFYLGGDEGKRIKVTGVVIEKHDLPVFIPREDEPEKTGIPVLKDTDLREASHRYLLKDAVWEPMEE